MIKIDTLTKSFSLPDSSTLTIFQDVNFSVGSWEFVAIMWQSGQGKTTLLNIIAWLEREYSGSVTILWTSLDTLTESDITRFRGKHMSYVFQEYNLIDSLTVQENIELVLDINKITRRFTTDEILERVGLLSKKYSYPTELSGWEKQRVALARSFMWKSDIILADEPTGSLDEKNAQIVMQLFIDLWRETKCSVVMITHAEEIAAFAETHYILREKQIVKDSLWS